ncbi:MAG: 50S ribosomal protein L25 [Candidatus Magasanikbacteria bacterium]|nr:50S ribosomal protein L25 [Candidatus Magasanikbacteria bacterium]
MTYQLTVTPRKENAQLVRASDKIPGVVYGPQFASLSITLAKREFLHILKDAGESTLIDCVIEGQKDPVAVLIQEVQFDPLNDQVTHVDLRQVDLSQKIEADIELKFVGEAPAVKAEGGSLVRAADTIKVKCLPKDLVHEIEVSIDSLKTFDDVIKVKDIAVPAAMEVLSHAEDVVAKVAAPMTEEELKALEEKPVMDVAAVEVEEKGKKEEEAAEGEAASTTKEDGKS